MNCANLHTLVVAVDIRGKTAEDKVVMCNPIAESREASFVVDYPIYKSNSIRGKVEAALQGWHITWSTPYRSASSPAKAGKNDTRWCITGHIKGSTNDLFAQLAIARRVKAGIPDRNVWIASQRIAGDDEAMIMEATSISAVCQVKHLCDGIMCLGNGKYLIDSPCNPEDWEGTLDHMLNDDQKNMILGIRWRKSGVWKAQRGLNRS